VIRGGSWDNTADYCRGAYRARSSPPTPTGFVWQSFGLATRRSFKQASEGLKRRFSCGRYRELGLL
ncbi:MAG TPA: hypothetical protein DEF45_03275, partial [Rhodopirellula sp.]|nr:hypothetical protein [Rhodopirellula sp.]